MFPDLPARCVDERVHLAVAEDLPVRRTARLPLAAEVGAGKVAGAVLLAAVVGPDGHQGPPEVRLVVDVPVPLALRERGLEQRLHSLRLPGPGDKVEARVALVHLLANVAAVRQVALPVVLLVDVVVLAREHLRPQAHAASEGVLKEHVVRVREDDVEAGQPHELLHHADLQAGHLVEVALPELRVLAEVLAIETIGEDRLLAASRREEVWIEGNDQVVQAELVCVATPVLQHVAVGEVCSCDEDRVLVPGVGCLVNVEPGMLADLGEGVAAQGWGRRAPRLKLRRERLRTQQCLAALPKPGRCDGERDAGPHGGGSSVSRGVERG
mmetsp:Transcript_66438/g.176945  ORF Transcript_66438/g.176945 Transcript_66438/m.176945 type:complete len:326 (-) Transcript_66438:41-1018(-)